MGIFHAQCQVINIHQQDKKVTVPNLLVDTGSECTWVPQELLKRIGVKVFKKDEPFLMANGETITRPVGYALLHVGEFKTVDEVVFAQAGDLTLLGARTLEGFGAVVDPRKKKLVAGGPRPAAGSSNRI
jgi:predicted aspartyl protease